jgi:hypothetical protein
VAVPADADGGGGVEDPVSRLRCPALQALAMAAMVAGCRNPAGPEPVYSFHRAVYAVVEVEDTVVRVLAEELLETLGRLPLRGAQAAVSGAFGSAALTEAAAGLPPCFATYSPVFTGGEDGCYAGLLPSPLGGREALSLEIDLPDGGEVRGALVTPELPVASIPPDSQRVHVPFFVPPHPEDHQPVAIVPILLEAAPGAHRVDIVAKAVRAFGGGQFEPRGCEVSASAPPVYPPALEGQIDWYLHRVVCRVGDSVVPLDSLDLDLHVVSMDRNYAGYMDRVLGSSAIDQTRAGFGLQGAVGVFGAVATSVLPLRIVREP